MLTIKSKEQVLKETNNGLDIFLHLIPGLNYQTGRNRFKNTYRPFYNDKKPSFSVFYCTMTNRWRFKDYGDIQYHGDCFDLVGFYFNYNCKKDFRKILETITDLIDSGELKANTEKGHQIEIVDHEDDNYEFIITGPDFDSSDWQLWQGILTEKVRQDANLVAVKSFVHWRGGKRTEFNSYGKKVYAYKHKNYAFIYQPENKEFKYFYIGNPPKDIVFGNVNYMPENCVDTPLFFLTGGRKDATTLWTHGYTAISLRSENAEIPRSLLKELYFDGLLNHMVILYDRDETGEKQSKELSERHGLKRLLLPDELVQKGGKDITDYVQKGFSMKAFKKAVKQMSKKKNSDRLDFFM